MVQYSPEYTRDESERSRCITPDQPYRVASASTCQGSWGRRYSVILQWKEISSTLIGLSWYYFLQSGPTETNAYDTTCFTFGVKIARQVNFRSQCRGHVEDFRTRHRGDVSIRWMPLNWWTTEPKFSKRALHIAGWSHFQAKLNVWTFVAAPDILVELEPLPLFRVAEYIFRGKGPRGFRNWIIKGTCGGR